MHLTFDAANAIVEPALVDEAGVGYIFAAKPPCHGVRRCTTDDGWPQEFIVVENLFAMCGGQMPVTRLALSPQLIIGPTEMSDDQTKRSGLRLDE